jgi:hypothetical protein
MKLQDYKAQYKALKTKKNLKGDEAMNAVKQNGYALQYVTEQTEQICLEAVKQNGYALQYVTEQTEQICLEAVKQNGDALRYVNEQAEQICLEAVKQNGDALRYVDARFFENVEADIIEVNGVKYKKI